MRHVTAALLLALPLAAFAQADATTAPAEASSAPPAAAARSAPAVAAVPAPEPQWSAGAGLGFGTVFVSGSPFLLSSGSSTFLVLTPTWGTLVMSLERRLGARTWLVVGADGAFSDDRNAWENVNLTNVPAERKSLVLQASAGLRHAVTRATAPVEVSLLALAEGGIVDASYEDGAGAVQDQTGWLVGGSAGFAVERVLVDRLSVRVSTPIVAVRYTKSETTAPQGVRVSSSGIAARLLFAPALQLRLAF